MEDVYTTVFLSSRRSRRYQPRRNRSPDEAARSVQSFASARVTATRSRRESSPPPDHRFAATGQLPDHRFAVGTPPDRRDSVSQLNESTRLTRLTIGLTGLTGLN
ncbi:hypothetical protein F2Q70_00022024 [Brassica cretica]|uniref:Uncharacterized protein n=1 Tax=Brassica cretica TaxID=69181 RepID=A0A8S9HN96_BRACR|nr:hypothetical protein F2Q70_00022024 [Brassica cretica]KAF2557892.1 hypothetical protein F2Q68_00015815 [Brassica cretica]